MEPRGCQVWHLIAVKMQFFIIYLHTYPSSGSRMLVPTPLSYKECTDSKITAGDWIVILAVFIQKKKFSDWRNLGILKISGGGFPWSLIPGFDGGLAETTHHDQEVCVQESSDM